MADLADGPKEREMAYDDGTVHAAAVRRAAVQPHLPPPPPPPEERGEGEGTGGAAPQAAPVVPPGCQMQVGSGLHAEAERLSWKRVSDGIPCRLGSAMLFRRQVSALGATHKSGRIMSFLSRDCSPLAAMLLALA